MTLVRFKNEFNPLQKWVNETLDTFNRDDQFPFVNSNNFGYLPPVNVKETNDQFHLDLLVPGRKKSDFNITLENELLTISAKTETSRETADDKWTRKEYNIASFSRTFSLPDAADASKINAEYTDGVLKIAISKKEQAINKGAIEIKIA